MGKVKQKTKKSLSRRFRITKKGKLLHRRSFGSHLKANKSATRRRKSRKPVELTGRTALKIKRVMGGSIRSR